jgi:hypothetical protein
MVRRLDCLSPPRDTDCRDTSPRGCAAHLLRVTRQGKKRRYYVRATTTWHSIGTVSPVSST